MDPVPFEQFMARALHDPKHGYYARKISGVGRRGDFTTAPMLSGAPARAIADWVGRAMRETRTFNLIEIGPGEGTLVSGVIKHLPWNIRWRTRLHLVETSLPLMGAQRQRLGSTACWHQNVVDALAACGGTAVIFSNELVDAFPVRRFQKTPAGWQELAVTFDGDRVRESLLPLSPLPDSSGFLESSLVGQCIEVHDSYHFYLRDWMPSWNAGRMLTIDYGAESEQIYHRRPQGTVRAYLLQQRLEGPAIYQNVGRQDITADVNFTDLQKWSQPWVDDQRLMSFGTFLRAFGNQHDRKPDAISDNLGVGTAFLVLDQRCSPMNAKTP
jgi:SAM-dependent MidA family methyltransferase